MKSNPILRSLVLVVLLAPLMMLSGCSDSNNNVGGGAAGVIFPAINPPFDSIDEVAVSPDPGGPYDVVLVDGTDYVYVSETESITLSGTVDPGGEYVRITGLATVTGVQKTYTVYTYLASSGVQVAANELTSAAVGLVADGAAAEFDEALGLVETSFGLPDGSAAAPVAASARSAQLTSVLAAVSPFYAADSVSPFDVTNFTAQDLTDGQADYMDCIAVGAMAYDSWHKTDAGGIGLPGDESDADYTRCKACHGWDQQGTEGGYVRRDRNAGRANAGYQDPNNCDLPGSDPDTCTPSRNISTDATFGSDSAIEIPGGGRTWAQGSTEFDMVDPDWGAGAILGNRHPDLSANNPGGPTADQLACLAAFLNAPQARADQVFAAMDTEPTDGEDLTIYTPVATADAAAGETYYTANCLGCHGDPSDDGIPDVGGLIAYLNADGKFSEFMHKVHWGIPDTIMSRASMDDPTAADVADLVAYMQAIPFMELSSAQEVPAVAGDIAGGSGTYTLTSSGLEYLINVEGLSGPIIGAHFHNGRVGTNGPVVRTIDFTDGQALGIWGNSDEVDPLTQALQDELLAGNIYVNIHTDANTSGEIRGQVMAVQGEGNQAPTADIAVDPDVTVAPETLVTLDGSGSSDTDGPSALTYSWILDAPAGSFAELSDPSAVSPTFTADAEGVYSVSLTVNDGLAEDTAEVTVTASVGNLPPVADAGTDQGVDTESLVTLDGSGSSDPDNGPSTPLTYAWTLDVPAGSTATLSDPTAVGPTFTADLPGIYTATLMVNDGADDSTPDAVTITATTPNVPPVADAGADQAVDTDSLVTLDGSGSSDPDTGPSSLTYAWTLVVPVGSTTAALSDPAIAGPTFTPDVDGTYTASLVVNDGANDSPSDSVDVVATAAAPGGDPVAGKAQYDLECGSCHAAGADDPVEEFPGSGDLAGTTTTVENIVILSPTMGGVSPLTAQEVLDLQAYFDSL